MKDQNHTSRSVNWLAYILFLAFAAAAGAGVVAGILTNRTLAYVCGLPLLPGIFLLAESIYLLPKFLLPRKFIERQRAKSRGIALLVILMGGYTILLVLAGLIFSLLGSSVSIGVVLQHMIITGLLFALAVWGLIRTGIVDYHDDNT